MTLRRRLALLVAAVVFGATAVAGSAGVLVARGQLRAQVDDELRGQGRAAAEYLSSDLAGRTPLVLSAAVQVVGGDGSVLSASNPPLPVSARDAAVAAHQRRGFLHDVWVGGVHYRVLTLPTRAFTAVQVAQPLTSLSGRLHRMEALLLVLALLGAGVALPAGLAVTRAGLRPLRDLTATAERVAGAPDLQAAVADPALGALARLPNRSDEVTRLARSVATMLGALAVSQTRQRRLVIDAGHELRTPLTSLRTNLELLAREDPAAGRVLGPPDRARLLADLTEQVTELTTLVGELTALARTEGPAEPPELLDLADVAARAVQRVRRRADDVRLVTELASWPVLGSARLLERAVLNVVDNAVKFSPPGGEVFVGLQGGQLVVADQGPGIPADDVPHVFERFYRSVEAREQPGSGLGLAIVAETLRAHGGAASVERSSGGGTLVRLVLPRAPAGGSAPPTSGSAPPPTTATAPAAAAGGTPR